MYVYITYQIKKCVYNKKRMCIYVCGEGGCLNKYISAITWPPQTKIFGSGPIYWETKGKKKIATTKIEDELKM